MARRSFVYTRRQTITQDQASIVIHESEQGATFTATLKLDELGLPGDAKIYVEVRNKFNFSRYDLGTISAPLEASPELKGFKTLDDVQFRVKVVEAHDDSDFGELLAERDGIKPQGKDSASDGTPASGSRRQGLLPINSAEIGESIWKVSFDEISNIEGLPELWVTKEIPGLKEMLGHSANHLLRGAIFPEVIRQILVQFLVLEPHDGEDDDPSSAYARWLGFAKQYNDSELPEADARAERLSWIDDVVKTFSSTHRFASLYLETL